MPSKCILLNTYLVVSASVESDERVRPEAVESHGAENNVCVVGLVVVANPSSDESPEGLDSWVRAHSGCLLWLATCINAFPVSH